MAASADDAQESSGTVTIDTGALNANAAAQYIGLRFQVPVPAGSTILTAYLDLALMDELLRIQGDNVALLRLIADTAGDRVRADWRLCDLQAWSQSGRAGIAPGGFVRGITQKSR